jgi:hypothetical protein
VQRAGAKCATAAMARRRFVRAHAMTPRANWSRRRR